jgi:hypothetical protein
VKALGALALGIVTALAFLSPLAAQETPAPSAGTVAPPADGKVRTVLFYWPG